MEDNNIHEKAMEQLLAEERELKRSAEEYFKSHKGRFYKLQRTNPTLNYIEFMQQEKARETEMKKALVKRLTKAINVRIDTENKK